MWSFLLFVLLLSLLSRGFVDSCLCLTGDCGNCCGGYGISCDWGCNGYCALSGCKFCNGYDPPPPPPPPTFWPTLEPTRGWEKTAAWLVGATYSDQYCENPSVYMATKYGECLIDYSGAPPTAGSTSFITMAKLESDGTLSVQTQHYIDTTCSIKGELDAKSTLYSSKTYFDTCYSGSKMLFTTSDPVPNYNGVLLTSSFGSKDACTAKFSATYAQANVFDVCIELVSGSTMYSYSSTTQYTTKLWSNTYCSGIPSQSITTTVTGCSLNSYDYSECSYGCATDNSQLYQAQFIVPPAAHDNNEDNEKARCFASSETVLLENGSIKALGDLELGDSILTAGLDGSLKGYSAVIAVPHTGDEGALASFAQLSTVSGKNVRMTRSHLLLAGSCSLSSLPLVQAGSVKAGNCVQTVSGKEQVTAVSMVQGQGFASAVTAAGDLIVVNGVIASPFATNHAVPEAWYSIHRLVYALFPALLGNKLFQRTSERFGDLSLLISQ